MKYILPLLLLLIASCARTHYIPLTTTDHSRDTIRLVTIRHDSIHLHDSIYITQRQAGDTIYITTTKYQLRDRTQMIHDTIHQVHNDTITRPITITATDPPRTTWRDTLATTLRYIIIIAIVALIIIALLRDIVYKK